MASGRVEQRRLLHGPLHVAKASELAHVAHAAPEFVLGARASTGHDSDKGYGGKGGKYVTHIISFLEVSLVRS